MFMKEITITEKSKIALQLWIKAEYENLSDMQAKRQMGKSFNANRYLKLYDTITAHNKLLNKLSKRLAKRKIAYYYRRINQTPAGYISKIDRYYRLITNLLCTEIA